MGEVFQMLGCGLISVVCLGVMVFGEHHLSGSGEHHGEHSNDLGLHWLKHTSLELVQIWFTFVFGWAALFSIQWTITRSMPAEAGEASGIIVRVVVAIVSTYFAFLLIYGMDGVADFFRKARNKAANQAVVAIIASLGILVGFSWERSFDQAIEDIAFRAGRHFADIKPGEHCPESCEENVVNIKILLAILVTVIVLPAKYMHIGAIVLEADRVRKEDLQRQLAEGNVPTDARYVEMQAHNSARDPAVTFRTDSGDDPQKASPATPAIAPAKPAAVAPAP